MRRREWDTKLFGIAEAQLGYFSTAQAREVGINPIRLLQLAKSDDIERASRGVYRLTRFPISPLGQYMEATLWPQVRRRNVWAVLSHESALSLYELSDVSPSKVHVTLPPSMRIRRTVPRHLVMHRAVLEPRDVRIVEGIRVTTPERTIQDVHANHIGVALELRLRERARATKDIDLILHAARVDPAVALERATAPGYGGFHFQR